jgi:multidrug resistance efflux pump
VSSEEMTIAETRVKNLHGKEMEAKKSLEGISKTVDSARAKVHEQKAIFQSKKKALELASKIRAQSEADKKVKEETSKIAKAKVELHVAKMKGDVTRIDQYSKIITESSVIVSQTTT